MASDKFYALWVNRNGQRLWDGPFDNPGRATGRLQMLIDAQKEIVLRGTQMSNTVPSRRASDFQQTRPARKETGTAECGPWIVAQFDSNCDSCAMGIITGSDIRSDGRGGWLCTECGDKR